MTAPRDNGRMRILHCMSFHEDDIYYRGNYYTEGLVRRPGARVMILTSTYGHEIPGAGRRRFPAGCLRAHGVLVVRMRPRWLLRGMVSYRYAAIIRRLRPDIVHLYEAAMYVTYRIAVYCARRGIPFVYEHEQREAGASFLGRLKSRAVNHWLRRVVPRASAVRVATNGAAVYLKEHVGANVDPVLVPLAYNSRAFFPSESLRNEFRALQGMPDQHLAIGTSGKFAAFKRLDVLVDAFKRAAGVRDDIVLFIVGAFEERYLKDIQRAGAGCERIVLAPSYLKRPELNRFYNGLDYGIWTTPTNSFFEAMGTGLPIIIPWGHATDHLNDENITFFGRRGGIEHATNGIGDPTRIGAELADLFVQLRRRPQRQPSLQYEKDVVTDELGASYERILAGSTISAPTGRRMARGGRA
jgi:glycosyltransferase involved in cell wall biosynthesis